MLTEESVIDQISVDEHGNVSVRRADRVLRDGVVIAESYHRHVLAPGDSLKDQHPDVQAIAKIAHTKERKERAKALRMPPPAAAARRAAAGAVPNGICESVGTASPP